MEPHLEMSYNAEMPNKILFYCHHPPSCDGGQTPICDMRKVFDELVKHKSELGTIFEKGVRYSRYLPSRTSPHGSLYSWEKTFYTDNKEEVEELLMSMNYEVEWLEEENMLHYWYVMPSVRTVKGEMVWSNQVGLRYFWFTVYLRNIFQSSVSHGSYYTHLPDAHVLGYTDQVAYYY